MRLINCDITNINNDNCSNTWMMIYHSTMVKYFRTYQPNIVDTLAHKVWQVVGIKNEYIRRHNGEKCNIY